MAGCPSNDQQSEICSKWPTFIAKSPIVAVTAAHGDTIALLAFIAFLLHAIK
jgi:hypothetical protein